MSERGDARGGELLVVHNVVDEARETFPTVDDHGECLRRVCVVRARL